MSAEKCIWQFFEDGGYFLTECGEDYFFDEKKSVCPCCGKKVRVI